MDRRALLAGFGALAAAGPAMAQAAKAGPVLVVDGPPVVIATSYVMQSRVLGEARAINVYLPPSYAQISQRTYPVLFLLDGGLPEDFHHITGLMQVGGDNGVTREMIVIGIADTDRRRDFTYPSQDPRDHKDAPTGGGSAPFRRFIAEELQPWVAGRFRTSGEKAIIGESLAGLFIVETFLKQPALFDTWIAISPSLWWDNHSLEAAAPALLAAMPPGKRRLWLAVGDEGPPMGVENMAAVLKANAPADLSWSFNPMPAEHHNSIFHPAAMAAVRQLYPAVK